MASCDIARAVSRGLGCLARPEITLAPLTDRGRALLDALEAAARGVLPFRVTTAAPGATPPTPTKSQTSSTGYNPTGASTTPPATTCGTPEYGFVGDPLRPITGKYQVPMRHKYDPAAATRVAAADYLAEADANLEQRRRRLGEQLD